MKRKSLLIMLLVALFVPLAMNAQTKTLKKSANGSKPKLEMKVSKEMPSSNPLLSRIEPAREAALEELSTIATRAVGDYELVTSEQIDWSGDYVITAMSSSTSAYVMTGKASGGNANYGAYTTVTVSNNAIASSAVNSYKVTITEVTVNNTTYYTLKQGSNYLALTQAGNYLYFVTTDPATQTGNNRLRGLWTISYEDDDYVKITNAYTTSRYIRFNNQNNARRFACYQSTTTNCLEVSLFKYNDGSCVPPTNFTATDVDMESATFSWTENGQAQYWVIYYIGENDANTSYEIATSNPFTLTGLTPATTYLALVTPYCGGLDQDSEVIEFTTEDYPCPAPTDLYADNVTNNSATLHWTSEAGSYNVQYRIPGNNGETSFYDDFEDANLNNWQWTNYTQGDDFQGFGWFAYDPSNLLQTPPTPHSGSICAMSWSYYQSALTANNYLVTPQVQLGGTLRFWVMSNYSDKYEVLLSTGGNAVRDFTVTLQSLAAAPSDWEEVVIDLSRYAGQQGYIAIHHSQYDGFVLFVDDFGIYGDATPAGPWIPATPNGNSANLTGLNPETTYEWQVQSDCGSDGQSLWSDIATFTTLDACAAPTGLATTDITNNSAALNWTGYTDAYNIQYREYDATAPVTIILNVGDVWGDGSGYQMLIDADATAYDGGTISDYSIFEYKIPTNADYNTNTSNMVVNNSVSIQIPAGTYDWFITNPTPDDAIYIAGSNGNVGGRQDNYVFEAGLTYEFVPSRYGTGDGVDVTITGSWTPVSGTVTSPYTLTGLNPGTTYAWQVKGDGCDNWSASNVFTTLNGTLVETITADDVTVTIGQTANITNLEVLPADATNPAVTYTSNDETVATVDENGVVTGVAVGTTTITIAATDGSDVSYDINVTVNRIDVTEITAEDVTVVNGETATISYTVAPENATDASVTFTSADETIATVDADGVVTGVGVGETTITITSVSNPDVTATITVTVTSNPNAVQFTVTAPSKAVPGDIITVEAYLNAPTSGNYDGFTGLVLGIHFDTDAFEAYGNPVNGPVANACTMTMPGLPNATHPDLVQLSCVMTPGNPNTTTGLVFSMQFTVLAEAEIGSYEFYAEPLSAVNFVYNPGSAPIRIPYEATPSTVFICEKYIKSITGYGTGTGNWYLIAPPFGDVAPEDVTNMLSNSYDLYYFDQDTDGYGNEWINYKGDANNNMGGFDLEIGKGYLYANSDDVDLIFYGISATESTYPVQLKRNDNARFAGWNLVGNPYTDFAYFADNRDFYTMNSTATAFELIGAEDARHIEAAEGVFVTAEEDNEEVVFTTTAPANTGNRLALNLSQGNNVIDRAFIRFSECRQLPKLQFNQNSTKVYIPMDDKDYAVVRAEEMGEMPVNFKAESNGTYSLNFSNDNVEFAYLHLIDNLTGNDVDLLSTPSYSFEASTTDYESRFKLVFATGNNSNDDNFAFFSNGSFVINNEGEATLQVIDVTGRVLKSETINGCANVSVDGAAGVYMLRLINGDNMKVQKVVVK